MRQEEDHARDQARAQMASVERMVKRLEHCENCSGEDCELSDAEIMEGLGYSVSTTDPNGPTATATEREEYHDDDKARQQIQEDALSAQVRSGWSSSAEDMKPEEFELLLCTGGPAVRIIGDLDGGQATAARLEYQDWGTPWTEYPEINEEALLAYANCFYWGDF